VASLLPDRTESRKLVVRLAIFWGSWGVCVSGTGVPVLVSVFGVVAFVSVIRFYFTLYGIEARATPTCASNNRTRGLWKTTRSGGRLAGWPAGRLALRRPADGAVAGLVDAYDVVLTLGQEVTEW
jgi:hypothetical protein